MIASEDNSNECLKYCLEGTLADLVDWGHEYLRCLAGEIGADYNKRIEEGKEVADLMKIVDMIVPYNMKHNAEPEAVDLLMEVESLERLIEHSTETNYERVCNFSQLLLLCC